MSPKIVRLVLSATDIEGSIAFSMYNVIQESIRAAETILARGGRVGMEIQQEKSAATRQEIISTPAEFAAWRDSINRVVLVNRPIPSPKLPESRRFFHQPN